MRDVSIRYGDKTVLRNVTFDVEEHEIFGIIGPANSGKTSFLRALNRMDELTPSMAVDGEILFNGRNIRQVAQRVCPAQAHRRRVPAALWGCRFRSTTTSPWRRVSQAVRAKSELDEAVERCLRRAALWDEVKDRLDSLGSLLSGGQQQRLTIAPRAFAGAGAAPAR